ncbi:hypothetical protein BDR22DRAFT_885714 [Usnea florida]
MTITILPFLGLLAVASAANPKLLQTRQSTCNNPVSDQELVKTTVDSNGNCPVGEYTASSGCVSYCEAKVEWFFGPEVPYSETQCQANSTCTFATAQSITVTNTYELNFGFTLGGGGDEGDLSAAFNLGASYSYSKSVGTTRTITQPRPSNSLQYCGYWTFLPYYITSCGTTSTTPIQIRNGLHYDPQTCTTSKYTTNDNTCNNTPYTDSDGKADGVDVFVLTNCADNSRLRLSQQDPRYAQAGVAKSD